jgi:hypothetical protein
MVTMQVVPRPGRDVYRLLRDKVTHEAKTWSWSNRAKTRLQHTQVMRGYIEVRSADSILVASVYPRAPQDLFMLTEKFIGRLTAWFPDDIMAINMQFAVPNENRRRRKV